MRRADPVELAIFHSVFHSIAEEMGAVLRRTGFSPNIKERRDYSCAVFDGAGEVVAMGDHMPVHLGSMPMSVRAAIDQLTLRPGDMAILNDPYAGGTHLPDVTTVLPVFAPGSTRTPAFYVASRAHHADIGGTFAGSMGLAREIYQEGIRIPPVRILRGGRLDREILALLLSNVRTPVEREGDLTAQIGACRVGEKRLLELTAKYGRPRVLQYMRHLLDYSEQLLRKELAELPAGDFFSEDFLDDDGISPLPVKICVRLHLDPRRRRASVDFAGTDAQVQGSVNAVYARRVLRIPLPFERGCIGERRFVAAHRSARSGGNGGQRAPSSRSRGRQRGDFAADRRCVAARAGASRAAANSRSRLRHDEQSHHRRNDPRTNRPFAYYETIAGGAGACPNRPGAYGVHTHMTNTLNTPAEALEYAYPLRVRRYAYRSGSGSSGRFSGGDGLLREIELLADAQITLLCDRHRLPPYGLAGGKPGACGRARLIHPDGSSEMLPGKCSVQAKAGDVIAIETPGGGGWGAA